ncbi:CcdB family protein [Cronobacter sakazakii]|uniref:CcdB family protein n=1 Tax=Cronobacter sakazakii TaxID=28141 RepID=UPI000CF1A8BE|nr:CcdB family protein [Cronobacter sakazakii]PPY02323.1 hypothetical protein C3D66_08235 [Cronobacter sakazakii]
MKQGSIFRRPDNEEYPYFVIAQSGQLEDLNTRVIIPFVRWRPSLPGMSKINPSIVIDGERYILMTQLTRLPLPEDKSIYIVAAANFLSSSELNAFPGNGRSA